MNFERFVKSQSTKLPIPTNDFSGQVVIVTGSNTGLGFEAVRHLVRLNAAKVIMAVRSAAKGDAAKADIEASTGRKGVIDVYSIDMASYESVKNFATQMSELPRIDAIIENGGMQTFKFALLEGNESQITVNLISMMLLAVLMLPTLRRSAEMFDTMARITLLSSGTHSYFQLPEWEEDDIFATLNDEKRTDMRSRYSISKLVLLMAARELAEKTKSDTPKVVINSVAPGLCHSSLTREMTGDHLAEIEKRKAKYARTTEEGSRNLVHATSVGWETHGKYLNDCEIQDFAVSDFITGPDGDKAQKKIWDQLSVKLDAIQPGVMKQL